MSGSPLSQVQSFRKAARFAGAQREKNSASSSETRLAVIPTASRSAWISCPISGQNELRAVVEIERDLAHARFRDQRLRLFGIVAVGLGEGLVVAEQTRRDRSGAERVVAVEDDIRDVLLVDRVLQRLADLGIVERRDRLVDAQELDVPERAGDDLQVLVALDRLDVLEVDLVGDIDAAGGQLGELTVSSAIVRQITRSSAGRPPQYSSLATKTSSTSLVQ